MDTNKKSKVFAMKNKKLLKLVITALFTALTAVATAVIQIPSPMQGYVNAGDVVVLLCGWTLGPVYGTIAAGVGSMLVDLATGYGHYAPGTLIIKAATALVACLLFRFFGKWHENTGKRIAARIISGIAAESVMVLGYFGYACLLLQQGLAAAASIPGNVVQGVVGIVLGILLCEALLSNKQIRYFLKKIR